MGVAGLLKRLRRGDGICWTAEKVCGAAIRFAGLLNRLWRDNGILGPAEKMVARQWDLPAC